MWKSVKSYICLIELLALYKMYLHKNNSEKTFLCIIIVFVFSLILRSNYKVQSPTKRGLVKVAHKPNKLPTPVLEKGILAKLDNNDNIDSVAARSKLRRHLLC